MREAAPYVTTGLAFLSTVIVGLVGWGVRSQLEALRQEFRAALAEFELRFIGATDKRYVRKDVMEARMGERAAHAGITHDLEPV